MKINPTNISFIIILGIISFFILRYFIIIKPFNLALTENITYFPLDNLNADYFVRKSDTTYAIQYFAKGKDKTIPGSLDDDKVLYIGSTPIDLDKFVDKKVKLSGDFINGMPYCKGDCPEYIGIDKRLVVKIDAISLIE